MRSFGKNYTILADAPPAADAWDGASEPAVPIVKAEARTYKAPYINERKKYELIIAASGQVVYDYDLPTGDIKWSGRIEEVLGYEPHEMGGIDEWTARIHPDDREEAVRLLEAAEKDRQTYDVDYRFRHKNGSYRWLDDRGFFLIEDDKDLRRMIGMMQRRSAGSDVVGLKTPFEVDHRIVDRDVGHGHGAGGLGGRGAVGADGVDQGPVPVGDHVGGR